MDSYEASRTVFSRIQSLEPENASKIMGYLLIQDYGEKEMIRLAFGPETLLQNLMFKAKTHLGLLSKSLSLPSTPSFNPISRPSPLSIPSSSSSPNAWTVSGFSDSPSSTPSLSYASVLNRATTTSNNNNSSVVSGSLPSFSANDNPIDEFQLHHGVADEMFDKSPQWGSPNQSLFFGSEDPNSGFGFRPCLYFQRGFCKNGNTCRFVHGDSVGESLPTNVGSPGNSSLNELEQCQELLRLRASHQQQKLASSQQYMNGSSFHFDNNNKCMNLLMQQQMDSQRSPTGSMIMGDEIHKFGRCRFDRNEIMNPSSRQIYLTFPADSTFREEDVSNYFSIYGPVQDVRIPYQQKRMFGFVTFVYPETVKLILAKGNPHFVCDSRVLVKPYKEKGKIIEKKQQQQQQQQQFENGDYSLSSSPSALDYDIHHGPRMYYNTQEMLLMKKLEERANLEQAVELHGRRLMNLQLMDLKNHHYHRHGQYHRSLSMGSSIPSPNALPYSPSNLVPLGPFKETEHEDSEAERLSTAILQNTRSDDYSKDFTETEESDLNVSIEHILPDSLFASPKKSASVDHTTAFSTASEEANEINNASLLSNSTLSNIASPESVFSKCSGFLLGMEPLECN